MVAVIRPFAASISETLNPQQWLAKLIYHYNSEEIVKIHQALEWAKAIYHDKKVTATDEALFPHALASAGIMVDLRMDSDAVCATLLFALADYLPHYQEAISQKLSPEIAKLCKGINKVVTIPLLVHSPRLKPNEIVQQVEAMRKMLLAMVEDIRVVVAKLAWRTQTMHYLTKCSPQIQQNIAQETRDIFAPLANRLGIWQIKWELEDLSFRFLEQETYKKIAKLLDEKRIDREQFIADVLKRLSEELTKAGIHAELMGRPKHIYSIYKKMQQKQLDFTGLYDIRAVRILVEDLKSCYTTLGIIHHIWQPIPGEFDDYISYPKGNHYRSLHTAVIGPNNKTLEIQIRTFDMHEDAEYGIAAHWRYKEGGDSDKDYEAKIAWIRQLLNWREDIHSSETLANAFKTELFDDTIYVMSPNGRVITLPRGATPIDFAYHIHTDLGHRCRGAKIDGSIVPLHTPLKTGQRVEILTCKEGGPSIDWLQHDYLKSSRAITKVKQWLRHQNPQTIIVAGQAIFDREMHKLVPSSDLSIEQIMHQLHYKTVEEFLSALGQSELSTKELRQTIQKIKKLSTPPTRLKEHAAEYLGDKALIHSSKASSVGQNILVEGVDKLMTTLAKCCKPVPLDKIVGFITKGRGISIHCTSCSALQKLINQAPERVVNVSWGKNADQTFLVDLTISATQHSSLLHNISEVLARDKINIIRINTFEKNQKMLLQFTIEISNTLLLDSVMQRLRHVNEVHEVTRG